ncbi:unnamed protein product [Hymenolepis diminuta]|uniref:PDZ GRASP-type domain-containing protein n=1 Tax=Hymenolepis diminuta TaxID=6216 RepID=A0A3P6WCV6_HYMDI|nr:unnamed protein product [Hymenolepis diminuta]
MVLLGMGSAESNLSGCKAGYHILKVQDGSPGQQAGLEAFFDFIVSVGDLRLEQDNEAIKNVLTKYKDKPMHLQVYSSKTQQFREVTITPSANWGGQGLLGLSIRYCSFKGADENVWHVLEVHPGSPAAMAGLQPFTDFIIGTDAVFNDSEDFFSVVEAHNGQPLRLYVYSSTTDQCREVTLIPNLSWGGDGMLGCEIGFGYLHRIPPPSAKNTDTRTSPSGEQALNTLCICHAIIKVDAEPPFRRSTKVGWVASDLPYSEVVTTGATQPPLQPPPMYTPQPPLVMDSTINGIPLAPPAPLPSNLFEGLHLTPPTTPPAFVMPSGSPVEPSASQPPVVPPPPQPQPLVSIETHQQNQQQVPPPPPPLQSQQQCQQAPQMPPPFAPPSMQPVPLIPTTNIAPPGMPPIAVQMPPTSDILTGNPWSS